MNKVNTPPHPSFVEATSEQPAERLAALKQLYPELFSDGKLNLDALKELAGGENPQEERTPGYYGLYWPGKRKARMEAKAAPQGTLVPVEGDGVNEKDTHNIYIEGDNLEVLRILKKSYKGRVKMIYIDPPYNTGNDFIYPDNYRTNVDDYLKMTGQADESGKATTTNQKSDGAFHTKWLNMMLPRLMLARELLTEDGVIFISIDDNEQANLKLLCDDVFGEENFVAEAILQRSTNGMGDKKGFARNHEYLICYQKSESTDFRGLTPNEEYIKSFDLKDQFGNYKMDGILMKKGAGSRRQDSPTLYFPLYYSEKTGEVSLQKKHNFKERLPIKSDGSDGRWTWGKEKIQNENHRLYASPNGTIYIKDYLTDDRRMKIKTILIHSDYITDRATNEIRDIFEKKIFDTPKPKKLIYDLLDISTAEPDSIILDFFSGSATTAHAVMQLNAEDGGNRKFIMVQLPELCKDGTEAAKAGYKTICEIGKERIRRAGKKIVESSKLSVVSSKDESKETLFADNSELKTKNSQLKTDIGFKVYREAKTNFTTYTPITGQDEASQKSLFAELEKQNTPLVDGWKVQNVLTEIILRQGFALDCECTKLDEFSQNTVYRIKDTAGTASRTTTMFVCLDSEIKAETIASLSFGESEKFVCLDSAIDDTNYARLCDKGRIETI